MKDETMRLIEERIVSALEVGDDYSINSDERYAYNQEAINLLEKLIEAEGQNLEYWDKEERRRIEENRNMAMANIEISKQDVNWKRMVLEGGKIVVPVITTVLTMIGYNLFQKRVMEYEKDGTIRSSAGRQLSLPKFMR